MINDGVCQQMCALQSANKIISSIGFFYSSDTLLTVVLKTFCAYLAALAASYFSCIYCYCSFLCVLVELLTEPSAS